MRIAGLWTRMMIGSILAAIVVFGCSRWCRASDAPAWLPQIDSTLTFDQPPEWAVLQRRLIDLMNASADVFIDKYLKEDGSFRYDSWGKPDDSYEPFHNWPTFYMAGGDAR